MRYGALFGWGIVIYAVMYLAASGLLVYGVVGGIIGLLLRYVVLIATAAIAGHTLGFSSWKDVAPYSASWAVVVAILDAVFWFPYAGFAMYTSWGVWLGYATVFLVPLIALQFRRRAQV